MKKIYLYTIRIFVLFLFYSTAFACSDDKIGMIGPNGEIDALPGMNLVGKITDGSSPIANVVVTDGYSVVETDENGIYQIRASRKAEFVYISVPSDCEVPMGDDGCPAHYQSIKILTNKVLYKNFVLKRTDVKKNFRLLALADIQIDTDVHTARLEKEMPKIIDYVKSLNDQPMYGISLGDLGWDNMNIYPTYKKQVNQLDMPIFSVIGNHDHNQLMVDKDAEADLNFKEAFGPTYYSYNIGDCHFVVMDDVYYKNRKEYEAKLTTNQLNWLRKDLSFVDKNKLIIIGVHIPIARRNRSSQLTNKDELYDILQGFNHVRVLSGHSHNNYTTTHTSAPQIEENTLGAVSGSLWYKETELCNDGSPSGYAIYEIEGNKINNWYYKGLSTPKEYQMIVYKPGEDKSGNYLNDVLVNIFTWHTNWRSVELYENGNLKQSLTKNIKVIDPTAYAELDGDMSRIETNNDHMFRYTPSADWTEIEVKAEDAYGNKYEGRITK